MNSYKGGQEQLIKHESGTVHYDKKIPEGNKNKKFHGDT